MAAIFISHSSQDNAFSEELANRLDEAGYQSLFLDFDPTSGIPAGRKWEQELYAALRACDVVVFLCTQSAMASQWCFAELSLARSLGRTVIGVMLETSCRHSLIEDSQAVKWYADPGQGWAKLLDGLQKARLTPYESFDWNPNRPPYPGLAPFSQDDAGVFFGRESEIANLRQLLEPSVEARTRCIIVTGPSGSGKSSLVRAGLLPRVARRPERWVVLGPLIPGGNPLGSLSRELARFESVSGEFQSWRQIDSALHKTPRRLIELSHDILLRSPNRPESVLLVIDQFEELVTRASQREREVFLTVLRLAVSETDAPLWAIATVRSEFLTPLLTCGAMAGLSPQVVLVGPVDRGRLPEVIEGPARRAGLILEDGLVAQMVEDCASGDALPLLAFVLRQLYESAWNERRLRLSDYKSLGGVDGAVRAQADRVLDSLVTRFSRDTVLQTLLETVTLGLEYEPMRRRIERRALSRNANEIIDPFVTARLYRSNLESEEAVVEVAHEAMFRTWPPLRDAVVHARDELKLRSELDRAALDWKRGEKRDSYLWSRDRLVAAVNYMGSTPAVSGDVQKFIEESARRDHATQEHQSDLIANQALRDCAVDPERAILLSLAAIEQYTPTSKSLLALSTAVSTCRLRGRTIDESLEDAVVSPDGRLLLGIHFREENYSGSLIRVSELSTNSALFTIEEYLGDILDVQFSSNCRWFVTGSENGVAAMWDASTGEKRFATKPVPGSWSVGPDGEKHIIQWARIEKVALSVDGGLLALFRSNDQHVEVWKTDTAKRLWRKRVPSGVTSLVFSPRPGRIIAGTMDGRVISFAAGSGEISQRSQLHTDTVESITMSSRHTLTVSADKTAIVSIDESHKRLLGHESGIISGALSHDGKRAFTGSRDKTVRCFDVQTGDQLLVLRPHPDEVKRVMLLPQDRQAVSVCSAQLLWWEVNSYDELCVLREDDEVAALAFAPGGASLLTGGQAGILRVWDTASGGLIDSWQGFDQAIEDLTFSSDGSRLLISLYSHAVLYAWPSGKRIRTFRGPNAALSPDGRLVAVASNRCTAVVMDAATGKLVRKLTNDELDESDDDESEPATIVFSPDGSDIVTASGDRILAVWGVISGEPRFILHYGMEHPVWSSDGKCLGFFDDATAHLIYDPPEGRTVLLKGHESPLTSLTFSPDGARALTASFDSTVRIWDAHTGEMLRVISGPRGRITDAVLSQDGSIIAAASVDQTVRLWKNMELTDWLQLARQRVFRELTAEERVQYGLPNS